MHQATSDSVAAVEVEGPGNLVEVWPRGAPATAVAHDGVVHEADEVVTREASTDEWLAAAVDDTEGRLGCPDRTIGAAADRWGGTVADMPDESHPVQRTGVASNMASMGCHVAAVAYTLCEDTWEVRVASAWLAGRRTYVAPAP